MKFYFAGAETEYKTLAKEGATRYLVSYYTFGKKKKFDPFLQDKDIFLDSGAFTAWSKGKVIDLDKYIDYLKENSSKFSVYANLDVIGNPEETLKNQQYMESKGVNPLPTIHYGADEKYLKHYAATYDYIALGGLVPYAKQPVLLHNWLNKCFKILIPYIKEKGLRVHGFGVGSAEVLKKYPFYSADSSGWLSGGRFGTVVTWIPEKLQMLSGSHYKDKNTYLKRGGNLKLINHHNERLAHNAREYLKMQNDITRLWESRGISYKED